MVKHYRDVGKVAIRSGSGGVNSVRNSFNTAVKQINMSLNLNGTGENGKEKEVNDSTKTSTTQGPKKKVIYQYIDDDSSSDGDSGNSDDHSSDEDSGSSQEEYYSEESASSSSSPYSDDAGPSQPPRKRTKTSGQAAQKKSSAKAQKGEEVEQYSEDEYTVEKIVDMKHDKSGKRFFLIKWYNYPSSDNTWEPIENLQKCPDLVKEYLEQVNCKKESYQTLKRKSNPPNPQTATTHSETAPKLKKCKVTLTKEPLNVTSRKSTGAPIKSNSTKASVQKEEAKVSIHDTPSSNPNLVLQVNNTQNVNVPVPVIPKPVGDTYVKIPHSAELYYFRVIDEDRIGWIYIDMREPLRDPEEQYKCLVTEDLTGKQPKLIYGATTAVNGEKFCLVLFEGHSYVEVIPPDIFFRHFPTFKKFFELHCPHLFLNSH